MTASSRLVICPTPVGNLADASERLVDVLGSADVIACEDSRMTGKLLQLLGVERRARLVSYHEHNARERAKELVAEMSSSALTVALVSDAGTPTISDPGYHLVREVWSAGFGLEVLPGPVAAVMGLSASGLPSDRFTFVGFLPAKQKARREALEPLWGRGETFVGYESPHRVTELLEDLRSLGECTVYLGRELTKMHEEHLRGTPAELLLRFEDERPKGEFVFVVSPPDSDQVDAEAAELSADRVIADLHAAGIHPKKIRTLVSQWFGLSKSEVFDRLEALKS
jgi:16S rRNA (cytidine1402-2'-O)-methyltransferase